MKDITDADYMHLKRVYKDFEIKNLGEFMICILKVIHYFRLMFSKTSEKCSLKIYHLDPVKFFSAPGLE